MKFILILLLLSNPAIASSPRVELAKHIQNFLFAHALCVEGTEEPCEWMYYGAYELNWTAKELQRDKPLSEIKMPESNWVRGGYKPFTEKVRKEHDDILKQIKAMIGQ